jgi:hypothetical protein
MLSGHKEIKLKINNKRSYRNYTNTWRLNNAFQMISKPLKNLGEIKKFLESNENESTAYRTTGIKQKQF